MSTKNPANCGIYVIRNTVNGKVYVGSASNIKQRWGTHRSTLNKGVHHSKRLQRSWLKHGSGAFVWEIIEAVPCESLILREQYWIDFLRAISRTGGFNINPIAGSPRGKIVSAETRAKQSAARKGRKMPPRTAEHSAAISAAKKGTLVSAETRAKQSAARLGKKHLPRTLEQRARISAAATGRKGRKLAPRSPEHSARISAAKKGMAVSAETRAKQSAAHKGRKRGPQSAEHRANLSAARKAFLARKRLVTEQPALPL